MEKAVVNGNDTEAREKMMYGDFMAGMTFNNAGLGHVHSISHPIGGISNRHHGLTTGALLPYVLEFNAPAIPAERFADMAKAMGEEEVKPQNAVETVLTAIKNLNARLRIPADLLELGVKEENIREIAENALKDPVGLTNPRQASVEDIIQLIRKATGTKAVQDKPEREPALSRS